MEGGGVVSKIVCGEEVKLFILKDNFLCSLCFPFFWISLHRTPRLQREADLASLLFFAAPSFFFFPSFSHHGFQK